MYGTTTPQGTYLLTKRKKGCMCLEGHRRSPLPMGAVATSTTRAYLFDQLHFGTGAVRQALALAYGICPPLLSPMPGGQVPRIPGPTRSCRGHPVPAAPPIARNKPHTLAPLCSPYTCHGMLCHVSYDMPRRCCLDTAHVVAGGHTRRPYPSPAPAPAPTPACPSAATQPPQLPLLPGRLRGHV